MARAAGIQVSTTGGSWFPSMRTPQSLTEDDEQLLQEGTP